MIELVIVIAVIAILSAVAIPSFTRVIRKAKQSAALAFADNILKTALVFHSDNGRWPNTWSEFAQNSTAIDASQLESCSVYNSRCSGNQTIFLSGAYITEFYTRPDEIRIIKKLFIIYSITSLMLPFGAARRHLGHMIQLALI